MSLRIVPSSSNTQSFNHLATSSSAPSAPGTHDTLRAGLAPSPFTPATASTSSHPLEARLKNWEATQDSLKMTTLRRTYGLAEPIRRGMELGIVRRGEWKPMALGGDNLKSVHEEILRGREDMISWEDVFSGEELRSQPQFHEEMERKVKMQQ